MYESGNPVMAQSANTPRSLWIIPLVIVLVLFLMASFAAIFVFWGIPNVIRPAQEYAKAVDYIYEEKYPEAIEIFERLGNYRDSRAKVAFCEMMICEDKYNSALSFYEAGDYPTAIALFHELGDFKDSAKKAAEIEKLPHQLSLIRNKVTLLVGNSIYLGAAISPATAENTASTFNGKTDQCIVEVYDFTTVRVSTAQEMLEAIAHYRKIILTSGTYDLSELPVIKNAFVQRNREIEGYSYHITGVNGLQIIGEFSEDVSIVTGHLYSDVLTFKNCEGIVLDNLSFGHLEPSHEYVCEGRVLLFDSCADILINNCELYGCGSVGLSTYNVNGLSITFSVIHHCTFNAVRIRRSANIDLHYVSIYNNQLSSHMFDFEDSEGIYLLDSLMIDNDCADALISLTRSDAVFIRCELTNNSMKAAVKKAIRSSESKSYFYECTIEDNLGDTFEDNTNATYINCTINNNRAR